MDISLVLLDSWDRQCRMVSALAARIDDTNRGFRPAPDSSACDGHLAHMHSTRRFFLSQVAPERAAALPSTYADDKGTPIADLAAIRAALEASALAIRGAVADGLASGGGPMVGAHVTYDNPVLLLQHMVWHDGWHVGQIMLALRLNGQEPPEEWEEEHLWGLWRTEKW